MKESLLKTEEIQIEKNDLEFDADIDFQNNSDLTIQEEEKEIQIENDFNINNQQKIVII